MQTSVELSPSVTSRSQTAWPDEWTDGCVILRRASDEWPGQVDGPGTLGAAREYFMLSGLRESIYLFPFSCGQVAMLPNALAMDVHRPYRL